MIKKIKASLSEKMLLTFVIIFHPCQGEYWSRTVCWNLIKFLASNISKDSPLYSYLATKEETGNFIGLTPTSAGDPDFVDLEVDYTISPKVLLINPPRDIPEGSLKLCIPPPSIAYVAAYLKEVGIQVELLDCIIEGWDTEELVDEVNRIHTFGMSDEAIADYLSESKPDIIGRDQILRVHMKKVKLALIQLYQY